MIFYKQNKVLVVIICFFCLMLQRPTVSVIVTAVQKCNSAYKKWQQTTV